MSRELTNYEKSLVMSLELTKDPHHIATTIGAPLDSVCDFLNTLDAWHEEFERNEYDPDFCLCKEVPND